MFSEKAHCTYGKNQIAEVICQLRFPEILTIGAKQPVDFQEAIRAEFPRYSVQHETPAPRISGTPGNLHLENQQANANYQFITVDGNWRINLTSRFISLTCSRYTNWTEFAQKLDAPLAAFIQTYKPAFFERIGLRYMNFFSREDLSLVGTPYRDLFQPAYLGLLSDENVSEQSTSRSSVDAELAIPGGCRVKIHSGPGIVKRNGQTDKEVKFVLDIDLFMSGNIPVNYSAGALQTLHSQAYPIFRGAISDTLHNAMEPIID